MPGIPVAAAKTAAGSKAKSSLFSRVMGAKADLNEAGIGGKRLDAGISLQNPSVDFTNTTVEDLRAERMARKQRRVAARRFL